MQLHQHVNMLGYQLQQHFGEKIYKLTLDGGFSCPNRDGTIGKGGCTFCNVSSFVDETQKQLTITQQLTQQASRMTKSRRFLAYFQAYTSTYSEVEQLKQQYEEALKHADIVGLCVGTRPDCVCDEVLDLLSDYHQQGKEVWLELGLQTAVDQTLQQINRGHTFDAYKKIIPKIRQRGIKVCTHLIIGLPQETVQENLYTLKEVLACGVDGLKLHPLHIVQGSIMAKLWQRQKVTTYTLEKYVDIACKLIRNTPANIIFHRVSANARKPTLLAPDWCENHWLSMNAIDHNLREYGVQGAEINDSYHPENLG